jgi:predicted amidohydrolase
MRVALAQINATVGDIAGNEAKVREQLARAREAGAQIALFPELGVTGYPPEDLLLKEHFLADARAAVDRIAADVQGIVALVGPAGSGKSFLALELAKCLATGGAFFGRGAQYSVAGSRLYGQAYLLDNTDVVSFFGHSVGSGATGTALGVEAIAEFQVLTATYGAQFGGNGAVLNAVTKSGSRSSMRCAG